MDAPREAEATLFLCIPDDAIPAVASDLHGDLPPETALVHCSGATPALCFGERPTGVLWPIQSITAEVAPDWRQLPLVVQGSSAAFAKTLHTLATRLSGLPPTAVDDDGRRLALHLGACLTQNLGNLLWTLTDELLSDVGLDYRALLPLARNHLDKLAAHPPHLLQTGPAARGDDATLRRHLEALLPHPDAHEAYARLSALIERRGSRPEVRRARVSPSESGSTDPGRPYSREDPRPHAHPRPR